MNCLASLCGSPLQDTSNKASKCFNRYCLFFVVGSIATALGVTLLFYSPLNLSAATGLVRVVVGSVVAGGGVLSIGLSVIRGCLPRCREEWEKQDREDNNNKFISAIIKAHEENIKNLISKVDIHAFNLRTGLAPIHYAAISATPEILKLLLDHGADVNMQAIDGTEESRAKGVGFAYSTPLHLAIHSRYHTEPRNEPRHKLQVQALLARGADMTLTDGQGRTPFALAEEKGLESIVKLLRNEEAIRSFKSKFGFSPIHVATINGSVSVIEQLYVMDVDVNTLTEKGTERDYPGRTALHLAIDPPYSQPGKPVNKEELVKALLDCGADKTITDYEGNTPLMLARKHCPEAIVDLLENYQQKK